MIDSAFAPSLLLFLIPSLRGRDASAFRGLLGFGGPLGIDSQEAGEGRDTRHLRETRDSYLRLVAVVRPLQAGALNPEVPRGDLARPGASRPTGGALDSRTSDGGGAP